MNFLSFLFYPHITLPAAPPTLTTKHSFVCYHLYTHGTTQEIKGGFVKNIEKTKQNPSLAWVHSNKSPYQLSRLHYFEMKNCQVLSSWKPKRRDGWELCVSARVSQILSALPVSKSFKPTQANASGWPRRTESRVIILSVKQLKVHSEERRNI